MAGEADTHRLSGAAGPTGLASAAVPSWRRPFHGLQLCPAAELVAHGVVQRGAHFFSGHPKCENRDTAEVASGGSAAGEFYYRHTNRVAIHSGHRYWAS